MAFAAWSVVPGGVWHDDGVYTLIGRALANGEGLTYTGVVGSPPAVKFPPVYPGFLAALWTIMGDLDRVTVTATLANLGFLALAGALLAYALRVGAGLPRWASLTAGGLAMVSGDVLRTSSATLSEPLFLVLAAACLALWPAAGPSGRGPRARIWLACLLVLVVGTRAAGLSLVAGFAVALLLASGWRVAAAVTAPAAAAWMGWSVWAGGRARAVPLDLSDILGPYDGWIREQVLGAPMVYLLRLPGHVLGVAERVAALMLPRVEGSALVVCAVPLLALAGVGWIRSARRLPPLAWASLAYAGLLVAWPYLDRRLVVPLHVLVMALVALGGHHVVTRLATTGRVGRLRAAVVALAAWGGYYGVVSAVRVAEDWPAAAYRIRGDRLVAAVAALREVTPPGSVVGSPEFWAGLHLHGGWTVAPSAPFDPRGAELDAPTWGTPEAQERLWRAAGIDVLLLEQGGAVHGAALDALEARCPGLVRVLSAPPPMLVVGLAWEVPCGAGRADR